MTWLIVRPTTRKAIMPADPKPSVNDVIDNALKHIDGQDPGTPEYAAAVDQVVKLAKINTDRRVSPDTLAMVAANLVGIVLITKYETANVITSKALGFILRPH